jgi:DNA polymerase delta subunit 1
MEGRVHLDIMIHMMKETKMSSYSLNSVAYKFLGEQKEDVHYSIMKELFQGNEETRRRIASYCLKDAFLPLKLMEKLMCLYNYGEMARVTGVPVSYLLTRGQQIKVASQLYRKAAQHDMIIPTQRKVSSGGKFEGAFVLQPVKGFYEVPIATLDFASLYPSIMIAHNLCYSTLVENYSLIQRLSPEQITVTPTQPVNYHFATPKVRKGLLPMILEELLSARKKARVELAKGLSNYSGLNVCFQRH